MTLVILTYNRLDFLKRSLKAWQQNGTNDYLIIDNGSNDGTQEWIRENKLKGLLLKDNMGQSLAQQIAFERIKDDWILFADDDVEPTTPRLIQKLKKACAHFGENYAIGVSLNIQKGYYPRILGKEGSPFGEFEITTHVGGLRAMSRKACKELLHIERDLKRYEKWRAMKCKVGYAKWLKGYHFGENDSIIDRGYEYKF